MITEMNNVRKDSDLFAGTFTKNSPVVEIFAAMVNGEELSRFGAKADKAVNYIKDLGSRADNGDPVAVAELNTLRRFVVETPIMEEIKLLSIFGSYQAVGYDETIEREVYHEAGEYSREQAVSGDVVFPAITKEVYAVPTFTISGGYAVDYRRVALGDMSKENEGMAHVRIDMLNKAKAAIIRKVYNAIKYATGVKYWGEFAGLTKTGVDAILNNVRRNGRPTVIGDYAVLSQFTPWAGYAAVNTVGTSTVNVAGISEKVMNEIQANGLLSTYNGAILAEMPNPYNEYKLNAAGTNFETLLPQGLAFVVPSGVQSPIATWTRGNITSLTGNDIKTGKVVSRFDLECAVDIAKGQEHRIGVILDTNLTNPSDL